MHGFGKAGALEGAAEPNACDVARGQPEHETFQLIAQRQRGKFAPRTIGADIGARIADDAVGAEFFVAFCGVEQMQAHAHVERIVHFVHQRLHISAILWR